MASVRWQLERALWQRGLRVGVLPPKSAPSVDVFPIFLPDDIEAGAIDRKLGEVAGRMSVPAIRGAWLENGFYSLELPRVQRQRVDYERLKVESTAVLPWLLGIDNKGQTITADLAGMPHILIAGATGSGKSNAMNAALAHLVATKSPQDVNLLLIDPKRVDLLVFRDLPHTSAHIPDMDNVAGMLEQLTFEVERRYKLFEGAKAKDLTAYNRKAKAPLSRVVLVVDEWAMLMDRHAKELEPLMLELLQVARASGVHVALGMQRPDGDVLRARLRTNLPARVCFRVNDVKSSNLIIDTSDAVGLLGEGDGLYRDSKGGLVRFQSPYISEPVLEEVVHQASQQKTAASTPLLIDSTPTIDPTLSAYEQAVSLARQIDWIASSDLLERDIATGKTVAKELLSELRKAGEIGEYDKSRKASPTRRNPPEATSHRDQSDQLAASTAASWKASVTQNDQSDQLLTGEGRRASYD